MNISHSYVVSNISLPRFHETLLTFVRHPKTEFTSTGFTNFTFFIPQLISYLHHVALFLGAEDKNVNKDTVKKTLSAIDPSIETAFGNGNFGEAQKFDV